MIFIFAPHFVIPFHFHFPLHLPTVQPIIALHGITVPIPLRQICIPNHRYPQSLLHTETSSFRKDLIKTVLLQFNSQSAVTVSVCTASRAPQDFFDHDSFETENTTQFCVCLC